jgi:hypothetical protein
MPDLPKVIPILEYVVGKATEPGAPGTPCPPLADPHAGEAELRLCGVTGEEPTPPLFLRTR